MLTARVENPQTNMVAKHEIEKLAKSQTIVLLCTNRVSDTLKDCVECMAHSRIAECMAHSRMLPIGTNTTE